MPLPPPLPRRLSEWKLYQRPEYSCYEHRLHCVSGIWTESIHRRAATPTPTPTSTPSTASTLSSPSSFPSPSSASVPLLPSDACIELIFLPGNPGIISYYLPFMNAIYDHCQGRYGIHGFNLAGFTSLAMFQSRKLVHPTDNLAPAAAEIPHDHIHEHIPHHYTLDEQMTYVDGCARYVEQEKRKQGFRHVHCILIGHSAGGNLAFRVLASRPRSQRVLIHCIGLMAFIRQDLSWYQRWPMLFLFFLRRFAGLVVRYLSFFPMWMKIKIVSCFIPNSNDADHVVHSTVYTAVDPHITTNSLYLGASEFSTIPRSQSEFERWYEPLLQNANGRCTFYYCTKHNDQWAPISQHDDFSRRYSHLATWRADDISTHAFCVARHEWSQLAVRVAQDVIVVAQSVFPYEKPHITNNKQDQEKHASRDDPTTPTNTQHTRAHVTLPSAL